MAEESVRSLVGEAARQLADAGVPSPDVDAQLLMAHVLAVPRAQLIVAPNPTAEQVDRYQHLVDRRSAREPLQHITGEAYFRHLRLHVGPGVFIPRPETEILVDIAIADLESVRRIDPTAPVTVVDLCTGSAAIPLAIATELSGVRATAVELSPDAAQWARRNIAAYDEQLAAAGSSVGLIVGDARTAATLLSALNGTVEIVTCNPPYIPDAAIPRDPEVRDYDPDIALYGGPDGLDIVRDIVDQAAFILKPGGLLLIEHGDEQGSDVDPAGVPATVAANTRFTDIRDHRDLGARPRVTSARRR